jgi:hypothetical protein
LNGLYHNGADNFPKIFELRNLSCHFSDTNVSRNVASYAHSLAGKSLHILSLSFSNFVGNEGGSGFLSLGVVENNELFENLNVFQNSYRDDLQFLRVHSFLIVKKVLFMDNSGRVLACVDCGATISFVNCVFSVPRRIIRIRIRNGNGTEMIPIEFLIDCKFEVNCDEMEMRRKSAAVCFFSAFTRGSDRTMKFSLKITGWLMCLIVVIMFGLFGFSFWLGFAVTKSRFPNGRIHQRL